MTRLKSESVKDKASGSLKKNGRYPLFKKINGMHPMKEQTMNSFVDYQVRTRHGGKVAFFNYDLAEKMGIISKGHPEKLNVELESQILDTFGIIIINEYDEENSVKFPEEDIRENKYMATRYLQLQHPNKQGKTSGDGRSIWNGSIEHKGVIYDISSCGTGATCLSPATAIQGKFFRSGDPAISYGCGYSEVDEGYASLFFSEVLDRNRVPTERVLAILEFEKGYGITVRVHQNLLRPSHLFGHLKQSNYDALKAMTDYFINRQSINGPWGKVPKRKKERYQYFLEKQTRIFAEVAAQYEDEYLFVWLDWDGDNILMDGGIIDYGSVRQFGLFHSEYRFDDGPRFSTSILEQKSKAKYIVQTFAQIADYLITKKKKPIKKYTNHSSMKKFEQYFWQAKYRNLLKKMGFTKTQVEYLLNHRLRTVKKFLKVFTYFERSKSEEGIIEVADGINRNAIFCMRDILRELPQLYLSRGETISHDEFMEIISSSYATETDLKLNTYRRKKVDEFQHYYNKLVKSVVKGTKSENHKVLLDLITRSSVINKYDRVTGDSISTVVNKVIKERPKFKPDDIYNILKSFSEYQNMDPDQKRPLENLKDKSRFMRGVLEVVRDYREGL